MSRAATQSLAAARWSPRTDTAGTSAPWGSRCLPGSDPNIAAEIPAFISDCRVKRTVAAPGSLAALTRRRRSRSSRSASFAPPGLKDARVSRRSSWSRTCCPSVRRNRRNRELGGATPPGPFVIPAIVSQHLVVSARMWHPVRTRSGRTEWNGMILVGLRLLGGGTKRCRGPSRMAASTRGYVPPAPRDLRGDHSASSGRERIPIGSNTALLSIPEDREDQKDHRPRREGFDDRVALLRSGRSSFLSLQAMEIRQLAGRFHTCLRPLSISRSRSGPTGVSG